MGNLLRSKDAITADMRKKLPVPQYWGKRESLLDEWRVSITIPSDMLKMGTGATDALRVFKLYRRPDFT